MCATGVVTGCIYTVGESVNGVVKWIYGYGYAVYTRRGSFFLGFSAESMRSAVENVMFEDKGRYLGG